MFCCFFLCVLLCFFFFFFASVAKGIVNTISQFPHTRRWFDRWLLCMEFLQCYECRHVKTNAWIWCFCELKGSQTSNRRAMVGKCHVLESSLRWGFCPWHELPARYHHHPSCADGLKICRVYVVFSCSGFMLFAAFEMWWILVHHHFWASTWHTRK